MALEIVWLNNRYRSQNVHLVLLRAAGWDINAFTVPHVKKTFLFHQHQGILLDPSSPVDLSEPPRSPLSPDP